MQAGGLCPCRLRRGLGKGFGDVYGASLDVAHFVIDADSPLAWRGRAEAEVALSVGVAGLVNGVRSGGVDCHLCERHGFGFSVEGAGHDSGRGEGCLNHEIMSGKPDTADEGE